MRRMKLLITAALLTGSTTFAATTSQPTTIQYGTWDETRSVTDHALLAAFEKSHPDITVKYNLVPWGVYWEKAAAMVAGGSTFDAMWMNLDNFPFYQSQGALSPVDLGSGLARMPAKLISPYQVDGKSYGAPLGPQAVMVYVNRALFKERGVPIPTTSWTYDQMLDAAKKLTFMKGGRQVYGINAEDIQTDLEYGMSFYYSAGGTGIISRAAGGYAPHLDATFQKVSEGLHDLIYRYKVSPPPTTSGRQGYQYFVAGQMGIYIEGSWSVATWKQNPDLNWAFAPFPAMNGLKPRPVYSAHALVLPSSSKNRAAAQTFVTWMTTSPEAQTIVAKGGLLPPQADLYRPLYLAGLPNRNAQAVFAQLPGSVIINADVRQLDNLPEVLTVLNQKLNLAWTGNSSVPDAIQAASDSMAGLLKQSKLIGK